MRETMGNPMKMDDLGIQITLSNLHISIIPLSLCCPTVGSSTGRLSARAPPLRRLRYSYSAWEAFSFQETQKPAFFTMFYYWKIREGFIVTICYHQKFWLKMKVSTVSMFPSSNSGEGKAGCKHHWYVFCWCPLKKNHFPDLLGRIRFELADKKLR